MRIYDLPLDASIGFTPLDLQGLMTTTHTPYTTPSSLPRRPRYKSGIVMTNPALFTQIRSLFTDHESIIFIGIYNINRTI